MERKQIRQKIASLGISYVTQSDSTCEISHQDAGNKGTGQAKGRSSRDLGSGQAHARARKVS